MSIKSHSLDFEIPPPDTAHVTSESVTEQQSAEISLTLESSSIYDGSQVQLDLTNPEWSLFSAVQLLMQNSSDIRQIHSYCKQEYLRRIWEPTYVIVYRESKWSDEYNQSNATPIQSAIRLTSGSSAKCVLANQEVNQSAAIVDDTLRLISLLH